MLRSIVVVASLMFVAQITAQSTPNTRELTFQIAPSPAWTDTGLNLQAGDVLTISAVWGTEAPAANGAKRCDPAGLGDGSASVPSLPVPAAGAGALIARLKEDATPIMVGAHSELHIDEASHLFLGMNLSGQPACQGGFEVTVQAPGLAAQETAAAPPTSRGGQLKSQLANAAQVFLSGQFGITKPGAAANDAPAPATSGGTADSASPTAPTLHISESPLDSGLRSLLENLPRRVNDQFSNLGDMVNFVIVGSQTDVQAALEASDWHVADTDNTKAALNAVLQTYEKKDYLAMPMSALYLFGRRQDFGYEMADPIAMVASRHHFRIWKAPFTWKGLEVWAGAGTHDIGFAKDKRNSSVTHKIDAAVDGERDNIGITLQKSNKAKSFSYYLPPNPIQEAKNATGDGYHSDGRLLVIFLQ